VSGDVVIQVLGLANGESMRGAEGQYLLSYTPDGNDGRGDLVLTPERDDAKRYAGAAEAMEDWKRVSATHPKRPDGKPNRPLSAFTISVVKA
jgi:hypothetical protein